MKDLIKNFLLLITFLALAACGSKSGGGGNGGPTTGDPNPDQNSDSLSISFDRNQIFFGLVDTSRNSTNQEVILTASNVQGDSRLSIETTGDDDEFALSQAGCTVTFQNNQTCKITVRFEPMDEGLKQLSVKIITPSEEKTISFFGVAGDYEARVSGLRVNLVDSQLLDGSWQDSIDFDFFGTQLISKTLLELDAKIGLPGLFNQAETGVLNYTQDYFSLRDDGMSEVLIDFDLDVDEQVIKWDFPRTGQDGLFVKEIPFSLLDVLNLFNQEQGFSPANYLSLYDTYIDSRRLSGNTSNMAAQYAYYISEGSDRYGNGNYHRILNDITILMDSLLDSGRSQKAQELARVIYQNYDFSADDLRTDGVVNLNYNMEPFVFSNPGDYIEVSQSDSILDKIYENNFIDCRIHGQALLLLSKAYQAGGFTSSEEDDILAEISFEWDNFNNIHSSGDFLGGACKPIRARVVANLPEELRDFPEISVVYLDLLEEIDDGDEINDLAPFLIGETLKSLEEILFY